MRGAPDAAVPVLDDKRMTPLQVGAAVAILRALGWPKEPLSRARHQAAWARARCGVAR